MALLRVICRNLMELSKNNIEDITKSGNNFAPYFFDHHVLPDINFNEHCL